MQTFYICHIYNWVAPDLKCYDGLECIQLIFEHELVHALMGCFCYSEETNKKATGTWTGATRSGTGHSVKFMSILNNIFGHESFTAASKRFPIFIFLFFLFFVFFIL